MPGSILFVCTHNSARSQMAEGIFNSTPVKDYHAFSAGTEPSVVHPVAVEVMREIGIDISPHYSKSVREFIGDEIELVVTVCDHARETCPFFPGAKNYMHMGFEDPAPAPPPKRLETFRRVRDEIRAWIEGKLVPELSGADETDGHEL